MTAASNLIEIRACFKIAAEAGMALDYETGERCETFAHVGIEVKEMPSTEKIERFKLDARAALANQLNVSEDLIEIISEEEYQQETEGDDEE